MPTSLQAAAVFAVLIVPGLLLRSGYNRTRAHAVPRQDLYAVAQAVVLSLAWLPVVWLLWGRKIIDWSNERSLADHQIELLGIVVLNVAFALAAGLAAGAVVDGIGSRPSSRLARMLAWTGTFRPPTPWDFFWLYAATGLWAAVEIRLANGDVFYVLFDSGSDVGLSPNPRQAFFDTEYRLSDDGQVEVLQHAGIFIDGAEVVSLRLEHLQDTEDDGVAE